MEIKEACNVLEKYLRLQTFPLAVRLLAEGEKDPAKSKKPKQDLGLTMPLCQAVSLSRRYGWTLVLEQEDMLCPLGSLALGFLPAKQKFLDGVFNIPFWVKDQEVRAKMVKNMPRLEQDKYKKLVLAPMQRTDFEPQVFILYANPAQISRLVQAAVYASGEAVSCKSVGGLACAAEIALPLLTGQSQIVISGGGDRALAQTQDQEAAFVFPFSQLETILHGLEKTHKAGMRYPTTSFLTYQAQFPPVFEDLKNYLEEKSK